MTIARSSSPRLIEVPVEDTVDELQRRYEDIRHLERELSELRELTTDLGAVVASQHASLDQTEDTVNDAEAAVAVGTTHVQDASQTQSAARDATAGIVALCAGVVAAIGAGGWVLGVLL